MKTWKMVLAVVLFAALLIVIGGSRNEVMEIHHYGAAMCLSCIGLE